MALIPWTILLGLTLPPKYDAGHWNLLWAGFDVGLLFVLVVLFFPRGLLGFLQRSKA